MNKYTLAEIKLLKKMGASFTVHFIPYRKKKTVWYKIEFSITHKSATPERGVLMTARGTPYTRASLDRMMELLRGVFPNNTKFDGEILPNETKKGTN